MSKLSSTEQGMLKGLVPFNSDGVTELRLTRVRYTGSLVKGMDWFINTNEEPIDHPYAEAMRGHEYLDAVRDLGRQLLIHYKWSDVDILLMHRTGINKYSKRDVNPIYDPVVSGNLGLPANFSEWTSHARDYPVKQISASLTLSSQSTSVRAIITGISRADGVFGYSAEQIASSGVLTTVKNAPVADGIYSFPEDVLPKDLIYASDLNNLNLMDPLNVRSLGIKVQTANPSNETSANPGYTFDIPFVKGTRRCCFISGGEGNRLRCFSFYRLGEGPDIVLYTLGLGLYPRSSEPSFANARGFQNVEPFRNRAPSAVNKHTGLNVEEMHALSWNSLLVDTYYGQLTVLNDTEELFGNLRVVIQDVEFEVGQVLGHLDKQEYLNYLRTGMGVFPPLSEERIKVVTDSWNKIPETIVWRYAPAEVKGYSVKNTALYKEYGKRREKACKTNDFLEQKYNDEYLYKQLENKLTSVTALDVWCMDRALCSVTEQNTAGTVGGVTRETTIKKINDLQFTATSTDGLNKTLPLTLDGIEQFVDAFMPTKLEGDVAALELLIGSMAEINAATGSTDLSPYDMRLGSQEWPEGPHWPTLEATRTYDQRVIFLLAQLSDYANFNVKLPQLLRSMMGDRMFPAMTKYYAKVDDKSK